MKYAFINGIILDGTKDMKPVSGKVILVDGEKIVKIANKDEDITGYELIDLDGKYIMPGLINLHVHLPASGKPSKKQQDNAKKVRILTSNAIFRKAVLEVTAGSAKTQLLSGVTTLRSVGGVFNYDSKVRDDINAGKRIGPRILAGNTGISVPGGHMAGSLAYECHNKEEATELVRKIAVDKPDLVKLMVTGGVLDAKVKGEPGELKMSPEIIKASCDEAHKLGFMVAAHVESPEGIKAALKNGVDTIEHGAKADDEVIKLFKEKKAALVTTISPALPYALFPREETGISEVEQYNGGVIFDGIIACSKACLENGIPVGLGTDVGCSYITHYDTWRELYYFHHYVGVTNSFALHTATLVNAQIVGIDKETGSIEVGKCADFIVTKNNPLDDLTNLRNIDMVVTRGKVINNPKPKKMAKVEKALNYAMENYVK